MLCVILDTNAIWSDPFFDRLPGRVLRDQARRGALELIVPEVVVREARNHHLAKLEAIATHFDEARSKLSGAGAPPPIPVVDIETTIADFETKLRHVVAECGGRILPFPEADGPVLLDRAVCGVRPFKESGEGVQDALIWLGALEAAGDADPLVLVSNDKAAFGENGVLHEHLASDVAAAGLPADRIVLVHRLGVFVHDHVPEVARQVVEFNQRVEGDAGFRAVVEYELSSAMEQPADYPVDLSLPLLEDSFSTADVIGVDLARIEATIGVPIPRDGSIAVQVEAEATIRFEYPVHRGDAFLEHDDTFESLASDSFLHERYASGVRIEHLFADFEARYHPDEETLDDVVLVDIRPASD